mmetsp:Transcript_36856/g.32566  ORF Transcript_36856/g.32566 Transcript_36856/m.32566 type:complete len:133 (+) Transcript_36856:902-1300(+)
MIEADWDDDGQIDYEEFLRALHPRFNEDPVTPKALATPSKVVQQPKNFIFPPSIGMGMALGHSNNNNDNNGDKKPDETNKEAFDKFRNNYNDNNNIDTIHSTQSEEAITLSKHYQPKPDDPLKLQEANSAQT